MALVGELCKLARACAVPAEHSIAPLALAQLRELLVMAQEAALEEFADGEQRRLLAYNKSFDCADAQVGDSLLSYKASNRKGTVRRRGPAQILDADDTGVTAKFQSRTFKLTVLCAEERGCPGGGGKWSGSLLRDGVPSLQLRKSQGDDRLFLMRNRDPTGASSTSPRLQYVLLEVDGSSFPVHCSGPCFPLPVCSGAILGLPFGPGEAMPCG